MNVLDLLFAEWQWYRRARGGNWFQVGPGPAQPCIGQFWIKGEPKIMERVYARESYP
jgi:hypothetical protein